MRFTEVSPVSLWHYPAVREFGRELRNGPVHRAFERRRWPHLYDPTWCRRDPAENTPVSCAAPAEAHSSIPEWRLPAARFETAHFPVRSDLQSNPEPGLRLFGATRS